jgi:hypothetical protein
MNRRLTILAILLALNVALHGQSTSPAASTAQASAKGKQKSGAKSQQQILLEQLNQKFEMLEQTNEKNEELGREIKELKQQLDEANKAAAAAQATATETKQEVESQREAAAQNAQPVQALQSDVADLKVRSTSLSEAVKADQARQKALEHPDTLHFRGIDLTPGGFLAAETVSRQRGIGGDVNTQFTGLPFSGSTAGELSEFNASGRQSRISLLAEGKLSSATIRGYYEADFLSAGTTSNNNQSNSYTLRMRQAWAQAELHNGWTITGGQMWSLATEYKSGLTNTKEAIPQTIDAAYNVGFTWERQFGFRAVKSIGKKVWIAGAVEEAQTLNIGGHNLPTIVYQQAGNSGGLYNPTANYSFNFAPDIIAKIAIEPGFGHYEVFGIARFFRDRIFPNAQLATGASALGAYTSKTGGGGIGANARWPLFGKKLDLGVHVLAGDGLGRYSTSTLPDATAHPDGSLELLAGGSALASLEWHPNSRLDVYGYYGGEYVKRAFYLNPTPPPSEIPPGGGDVFVGYGAPNNNVSGCSVEALPVTSPNGGGNVPGAATGCNADNRDTQEGTIGYWFRFYKGSKGTLQQGIQYSYAERQTWQGAANPNAGINGVPNLGSSPKAIDNMWFLSFRYYLPQ